MPYRPISPAKSSTGRSGGTDSNGGFLLCPTIIELREILADEITDELGHASYLMDIIVDLGGEPTTTPMSFEKPEGQKAMLELDLEMEKHDVENYRAHAAMAEELGLVDIQLQLEDMAADGVAHAREGRRLLKGL